MNKIYYNDIKVNTPEKYYEALKKGHLASSIIIDELKYKLCFDYLKKCGAKDEVAQYGLAYLYDSGKGCNKDSKMAFKILMGIKKSNDPRVGNFIGNLYSNGEGVKQDYQEAVKWYKKSAEQGNSSAQYNLGGCYYIGHGVKQDYQEAVKWYKKSAEQGNSSAQYNLGGCYNEGHGVKQDYQEAVKWWRKSAEQGNSSAQYNLGWCYNEGHGVKQDYQEAVKWYKKLAEQGNSSAQNNLGGCYYKGHGVNQDYQEAVKWYKKSAEQGNSNAQNNLGGCYNEGHGVKQDYQEAVKWYKKSAEQGNAAAACKLKELEEKIATKKSERKKEYSQTSYLEKSNNVIYILIGILGFLLALIFSIKINEAEIYSYNYLLIGYGVCIGFLFFSICMLRFIKGMGILVLSGTILFIISNTISIVKFNNLEGSLYNLVAYLTVAGVLCIVGSIIVLIYKICKKI